MEWGQQRASWVQVGQNHGCKKGRPGAVVRAVSLSHQVVGSKQHLRRFCGGKACLGLSLPQTPLTWEPPALGLPFPSCWCSHWFHLQYTVPTAKWLCYCCVLLINSMLSSDIQKCNWLKKKGHSFIQMVKSSSFTEFFQLIWNLEIYIIN
jgi:hypothetical protein